MDLFMTKHYQENLGNFGEAHSTDQGGIDHLYGISAVRECKEWKKKNFNSVCIFIYLFIK